MIYEVRWLEFNLSMGHYLSVNNVNFLVNNVQFYSVNSNQLPKAIFYTCKYLRYWIGEASFCLTQFLIILHLSIVCRACNFFFIKRS